MSHYIDGIHVILRASQVALVVKNLPAYAGDIRDAGSIPARELNPREDPLEEGMAIQSSNLACKIPWTEEPGGLHTIHEVIKSWTRLSN